MLMRTDGRFFSPVRAGVEGAQNHRAKSGLASFAWLFNPFFKFHFSRGVSMKRSIFFVLAAFAICFFALTSQASAQATRTWVSGLGDDANPCSRTAPCKTFAGAISKTADCGEMDALDPGGFGTVTITKGVKLDGGGGEGGQVASILASGTPGITINNSSVNCPFVVIRNLDIQGIKAGT